MTNIPLYILQELLLVFLIEYRDMGNFCDHFILYIPNFIPNSIKNGLIEKSENQEIFFSIGGVWGGRNSCYVTLGFG